MSPTPEEPEDESTEARFRRVQEELRAMELPDMPDDEVDARLAEISSRPVGDLPQFADPLDALERRAAQGRALHSKAMNADSRKLDSDRRATKGLGVGMAMAYTMLGLPLLGLGLGYLLNRVFPGPWIALGVVAGFVAGVAFALALGNREKDRL